MLILLGYFRPFPETTYSDVLYALIKLVVRDPGSCIDDGQLDQITIGEQLISSYQNES